MPSIVCLLALFLGCSGGEEVVEPTRDPIPPPGHREEQQDEAEASAQPGGEAPLDLTAPAAPSAPEGLAQLAAAGHHAAALAAARAAIAASPEDAEAWRLLGLAARASGQGPALLAELDVGQAAGGQAAVHHLLRAELAMAGGHPAAALEAATLAAMADADAGAGAQALAVDAGAPVPGSMARSRPEDAAPTVALVRLAGAKDARAAAPWLDGAAQVTGWRADLARARALARTQQRDAALAAYEEAAAADDPRGVLAANLGRAELALDGGDSAQALAWAQAGAEVAAGAGDVVGAAAGLELALRAGQAALDLDGPLVAAQAASDKALAASGGTLAPELGLALGRAGLVAGRSGEVVRTLWTACMAMPADGHPQRTALEGITALTGWYSGLDVAVTAVAYEGGATPAATLASVTAGSPGFAPTLEDLADIDAALFGLAAAEAHVDPARRLALLRDAAAAADRAALPSLRLQAWLAVDQAARAAGQLDAAGAARAAAAAVSDHPGSVLQAELAVRAALAGDTSGAVPPEAAGAWAALLAGTAPPAGEDLLSGGVSAWAAARALASQGKDTEAAKAYLDALGQLPTHRFGRLSLGTALDGSQGLPIAAELSMVADLDVEAGPVVALAAHEMHHRVRDVARQVAGGRGLMDGVSSGVAAAALGSAARVRAETARWLLGGAPAELGPVVDAEAKLADQRAFVRLLPTDGAAAVELARDDAGTAVISAVQLGDRLSVIVLSGRGFAVKDVGSVQSITAAMARHSKALAEQGPVAQTGNVVRQLLLDPFNDQLAGVPRFVVVAPAALQQFGIANVPEQDDALRWLEDIRDVSVAPTLSALVRPELEPEPTHPDLLALGPPLDDAAEAETKDPAKDPAKGPAKAKVGLGEEEPLPGEIERGPYASLTDLPPELAVAVRTFSRGTRQLVVGEHATIPTWDAGASTARIVQISRVEAAPGGGFRLHDGNLGLADIRSTPIQADLVVITAAAPTETQIQRAQAFLDAGARTVVVAAWEPTAPDLERYISTLYDAMNQERPVIRAMEQGRLAVRNDPLRASTNTEPGVWGAWLMVGRP